MVIGAWRREALIDRRRGMGVTRYGRPGNPVAPHDRTFSLGSGDSCGRILLAEPGRMARFFEKRRRKDTEDAVDMTGFSR